jgi:hypothetical protein
MFLNQNRFGFGKLIQKKICESFVTAIAIHFLSNHSLLIVYTAGPLYYTEQHFVTKNNPGFGLFNEK